MLNPGAGPEEIPETVNPQAMARIRGMPSCAEFAQLALDQVKTRH
jgi:hypothetical protein